VSPKNRRLTAKPRINNGFNILSSARSRASDGHTFGHSAEQSYETGASFFAPRFAWTGDDVTVCRRPVESPEVRQATPATNIRLST